jgi:hypothetical protein
MFISSYLESKTTIFTSLIYIPVFFYHQNHWWLWGVNNVRSLNAWSSVFCSSGWDVVQISNFLEHRDLLGLIVMSWIFEFRNIFIWIQIEEIKCMELIKVLISWFSQNIFLSNLSKKSVVVCRLFLNIRYVTIHLNHRCPQFEWKPYRL